MPFVRVNSGMGVTRDVLNAISQVKSLFAQLAALDGHPIIIVKSTLQAMRSPDSDSSPNNYVRLVSELGVAAGEAGTPTALVQAQTLYNEIEALVGALTNDATTIGALKAQATKVAALVTGTN